MVLQLMNNLALYVTGPLCHRGHRARNHSLPTPLAPPLSIGRCKLAIYISISRRNIAARNLANRLPRSDTRCYITCAPIKTTWNAFNHFRKFVRLIRSPISSPRFAIQTRQWNFENGKWSDKLFLQERGIASSKGYFWIKRTTLAGFQYKSTAYEY